MTSIPSRQEILAVVKKHLMEVMGDVTEEEIDAAESMADLAVNSLEIVEVISLSMREFRVKIPRSELILVENLNQLVELLHAAVEKAATQPEPPTPPTP